MFYERNITKQYLQFYFCGRNFRVYLYGYLYKNLSLEAHTHTSCDSAYLWVVGLKLIVIFFDLPGPCTNYKVTMQEPLFPLSSLGTQNVQGTILVFSPSSSPHLQMKKLVHLFRLSFLVTTRCYTSSLQRLEATQQCENLVIARLMGLNSPVRALSSACSLLVFYFLSLAELTFILNRLKSNGRDLIFTLLIAMTFLPDRQVI